MNGCRSFELATREPEAQAFARPSWPIIALCWLAIGVAWAPAVFLMDGADRGLAGFAEVLVLSVASFVPWIAVTPMILKLCRKADLARRPVQTALGAAAALIAGLPLIAAAGRLCSLLASRLAGFEVQFGTGSEWLRAVIVTSLFSLPTGLAVVAIGLVLAASERASARERLLANARLDALRAELNPHFLFNSLGGIAQLAHQSPDQAERAIGTLADIMRSTLAEKRRFRPLSEEIGAVRDHLELYAALVEGIGLDLQIEPEAWQLPVPSHILTPLIENATTHGQRGPDGEFRIALTAIRDGGRLRIALANPCAAVANQSQGLGSGIANVRARLASLFGDRAEVSTARDRHFAVTLAFPINGDDGNA